MSPALRNFLITFAASLLVFGLIAWFVGSTVYGIFGGLGQSNGDNGSTDVIVPKQTDVTVDEPLNVAAESFTVLLIGTDIRMNVYTDYDSARPEELVPSRPKCADAAVLLHFDKESREIVICGIPTDTSVQLGGAEVSLADYYGCAGVDAFRAKVAAMTGFKIDYYFVMDVENFSKAYGKAGWSVTVDIPSVVNDGEHNGMYYVDEAQGLTIDLPAGPAVISTGVAAEQYLLFVGDGETARMNRITDFIQKIIENYGMKSALTLYKSTKDLFVTDMTVDDLTGKIDLINAYDRMTLKKISYPIPSETAQKYRH